MTFIQQDVNVTSLICGENSSTDITSLLQWSLVAMGEIKGYGNPFHLSRHQKRIHCHHTSITFPNWCASVLTNMILQMAKTGISFHGQRWSFVFSVFIQDNKLDPGRACPRVVLDGVLVMWKISTVNKTTWKGYKTIISPNLAAERENPQLIIM